MGVVTDWCSLWMPGSVAERAERHRGYRVPSARLSGFDYGQGVFFVTVVTKGRVPWFGTLANGRVQLAPAGRVVMEEWTRTGVVRDAVLMDALVVMPDHIHRILALGQQTALATDAEVKTPHRGVSTNDGAPAWRPGVLGAVVGRWKSECTRRIRVAHPDFAWQPRFHDIVIRDGNHPDRARQYIADNPGRAHST